MFGRKQRAQGAAKGGVSDWEGRGIRRRVHGWRERNVEKEEEERDEEEG